MNRLQKYKESLQRFIKDKSCLYINNNIPCKTCDNCINDLNCIYSVDCSNCKNCKNCLNCKNCKISKTSLFCKNCSECKNCYTCDTCNRDINDYIFTLIQENDSIYSTLFLTIMNNQNRKNHMSLQGYYAATTIEFFDVLINVIENRDKVLNMFGINKYIKLCNNLYIYAIKSLHQNIDTVKNVFLPHNVDKITISMINLLHNTFKNITELSDHKFEITNNHCNLNIIEWYLKNNNDLIKKFKALSQITKESIKMYASKKYFYMSELSISLGWMFGHGSISDMDNFKQSFKYFGMMYKISKDFEMLEKNIENSMVYSSNYVVNFGLQEGYEEFVNNKQLFIADMLSGDIYSNTIKEIIDKIELNIDIIIDQTSPDLKSSYSMDHTNPKVI
jgi:hypothetical protein